ncbi:MAG: hypothetical protein RIQ93_3093, partial [Verrucomicrobiota bacterium]
MSLLTLTLVFLLVAAVSWALWLRAQGRKAQARQTRELAEQRRQREEELRVHSQRTTALLDRMVEGLIVVGANGRIRLANRAAGELFGFTLPADGRTILEATRHHEVGVLMTRLESEPEVLNHELRLEGVNASRYLQVNALALRTSEGARDGAMLVFHDLTRIRRLEAVRQEFVANVSHELRTPLSLIKSAAETLIDGGRHDPDVTTRFLQIINKHADRLTLLIDDLLLLARLDAGRIELHLKPVVVRDVAQEALDDAALLARTRNVTLTNLIAPDFRVMADTDRLRQVLGNLVANAIKHGRADGAVTLDGRALDGCVELRVRDDGPGIPLEARARIFERFYRAD